MGDRSVSARDISRAVVVTGDGNNVALSLGDTGIRLPLRRKQFPSPDRRRPRAGEPPRELDLLVAEAGKLPLVGRTDLLDELQSWRDDEHDISVHALIGRAGSGKTRLAIEFCRKVDDDPAGKGEWIAGFLSPVDLGAVVETLTTHSFKWERPTLLVVDYAAQCHQALARWLDRLAEQKLDTKLRILLLDREAPDAFGWWHDIAVSGPPRRGDLFYELRPRELPDLSDREERRGLMAAARQAAREFRAGPSGDAPIPAQDADADFDHRLAQPQFGNPLNLVMAGVIAVDRGPQAALALRRLDAARYIARRELRRLADLARSRQIEEDATRHVIAFNGLAGGLPIAGLRKIVADELTTSLRQTNRLSEIVELLEQEYPPRSEANQQPRLATIQPDLIGEAAIVEALSGNPSREAEAAEVVRRAYSVTGEAAAQALFRLLQDFAYAAEDPEATSEDASTGRRLMSWLLDLARRIDDPDQLVPLVLSLPLETTILREPAAELTQNLATHFVNKAQETDDSAAFVYSAALLGNLGVRLSALGRHEEALTAAEEAVGHYRALAAARPDAFIPDLALSLNNLANFLSDLGRREAALTAAEEAVGHYRALAAARPDAFIPDLARSLNNLANCLSALGRHEAALTTAEEAVGHYRALAVARPDAFVPDLAGSLNNLANFLSALGRHEAALTTAEEAVGHYRALAAARPDAFVPDLAGSLNNLANFLSDLGRREEALAAAEEAVGHYRALVAARPDAFIPELALSLNNLAHFFSDLGRHEAALTAAEEAVGHYGALAGARPDAFVPNLAGSLNNLANRLSELGRREAALAAAEEAVGHYRALAAARPDAFIPDLALSLNNLANCLSDLGRREEALTAAEEAVGHYRALAAAQPDAFIPDLALSLNNLANRLSDLGRREAALTAAEEALGHYRALAAARPDAFIPHLALSLNNLANCLSALGRHEAALTAAEEAVRLRRALAAARPDAFIPDLALSLNNLANRLSDLGRREAALTAAEEAVGHYRALAAARPDAFIPHLALSLNNLANCLSALGRREAALTAAEEAVGHYRALAAARPDAFNVEFAQSLWVLGDLYGDAEQPDLAIDTLADGVRQLTPTFARIPAAVARIMAGLGQSYEARCAMAGREPDRELLGPVIAIFAKLQEDGETG